VLLHECYPYTREGAYLAAVYENVYLDLSYGIPFLGYGEMATFTRAAFGVARLVFQGGYGASLFGFEPHGFLDAWVVASPSGNTLVRVDDASESTRSTESRLGEALLFTTLMAPWNRSDGRLSRFTCETCHFEGYVDGRTHFTGRGDVHATTKPLLGLFNNRPHFSRALDRDITTDAAARDAYAARQAAALQSHLSLRLDGAGVTLKAEAVTLTFPPGQGDLPTLRLSVRYTAAVGTARERSAVS